MDYRKARVTSMGLWLMERRARQTLTWCQAKRILEIGPGRGVFAREACAHQDVEYWAVDADNDVLNAMPPQATTLLCRVPSLARGDPVRFGAVVAEAVLEHMSGYEQAGEFIADCRQHLIPGGRLILRFPEIRFLGLRFWEYPPDHQYVTSLARVAALVEQEGFSVLFAGHFVDCWTGPAAHLVWWLTRLIPTRLLHRLAGGGYRKTIWSKLGEKAPQGYLVAQRMDRPRNRAKGP